MSYGIWIPRTVVAKAVVDAGFDYDLHQDIIYSRMHAWQRWVGYCWQYDALAPALNMIIDCEPICFTYDGAKWMIELWKGQYGIMTGAEIGVYRTCDGLVSAWKGLMSAADKDLVSAGKELVSVGLNFNPSWYECADSFDLDKFELQFTLKRKGQILFKRHFMSHWWLTGFKWGLFTGKTSDLTMHVAIRFKNEPKQNKFSLQYAFTDALWKMGYHPRTVDQRVDFDFDKPKTLQIAGRSTAETKQSENKILVAAYNELKAVLGLMSNDPNGFDIRNAADRANAIFAQYFKKKWRS
jgi:hypothetical protein